MPSWRRKAERQPTSTAPQSEERAERISREESTLAITGTPGTASRAPEIPGPEEEDSDFPDGGRQAWLVVLGSSCANFIVFGLANSTAVLQETLASGMLKGVPVDVIGWIFSTNLFLTFLGGMYVGSWFDAHGPQLPVLCGCVGMVVGLMLLSFCTKYWHFLLDYGILLGLSGGLLCTPAYASITHFFKRRRGLATGIASMCGALAGVVLPLILRSLLPRVGFSWTIRVIGFVFLALAIPAKLFIKKRLPATVASVGIVPDLSPLRDPSLALCTAGTFLMEWGVCIPLAYISSYATSHGQRVSFAFLIVTLLNVGSCFGRWIPGLIADRFGRFNVILVTLLFCAISVLCLWLPSGDSCAMMVVFAIVFGFASGSNFGLIPVCLAELCQVGEYGRYYAASYFLAAFGTLTSVPIGGALIAASNGQYSGLTIFSGVAYLASWTCYAAVRVMSVGLRPIARF